MPVELIDKGRNNQVELHPWFETNGKLKIQFTGDNSRVSIPAMPLACLGMVIELGPECSVEIGAGCRLNNAFIFGAKQCHVRIGEGTTLTARVRFIMHEPSTVTLGRDCMIATDVQFMPSDAHSILEASTGERINPASDIVVGDHVWLGLRTVVMKGASIGAGAVVGLHSVVTGSVPANCVAAGTPARVIRENVRWDRKLL